MGTGHSILKPFQTRFKPFIGQPVCCCQIPLCHNLFRFWFLVTRCFQIPYMGVGHSKRPLWTKYLFENWSWAFKARALNPVFFEMGVGIQSACFEPGILFWKWQLVTICKCWWASFEAASTFFTFANLLSEWFSLLQVPVWAYLGIIFCKFLLQAFKAPALNEHIDKPAAQTRNTHPESRDSCQWKKQGIYHHFPRNRWADNPL